MPYAPCLAVACKRALDPSRCRHEHIVHSAQPSVPHPGIQTMLASHSPASSCSLAAPLWPSRCGPCCLVLPAHLTPAGAQQLADRLPQKRLHAAADVSATYPSTTTQRAQACSACNLSAGRLLGAPPQAKTSAAPCPPGAAMPLHASHSTRVIQKQPHHREGHTPASCIYVHFTHTLQPRVVCIQWFIMHTAYAGNTTQSGPAGLPRTTSPPTHIPLQLQATSHAPAASSWCWCSAASAPPPLPACPTPDRVHAWTRTPRTGAPAHPRCPACRRAPAT